MDDDEIEANAVREAVRRSMLAYAKRSRKKKAKPEADRDPAEEDGSTS